MLNFNKKGQTLIEVLLSVGISVIVISALVLLAINGMRNTRSALARSVGEKLAVAGIEAVKITRDINGYGSFAAGGSNYMVSGGLLETCSGCNTCGVDPNPVFHELSISMGNIGSQVTFCRQIYVSSDSGGKRDVKVRVVWVEGLNTRDVNLSAEIYDY